MQKSLPWKHSSDRVERQAALRPQAEHHHAANQKSAAIPVQSGNVQAEFSPRALKAEVLFFLDHAISLAVGAVARKQAHSARLMINGKTGVNLHVCVGTTGEGDSTNFVAYNNDMCLFMGAAPTLYVVNQTAREIEHSIYLFVSERLAGESSVTAQIFRETGTMFDLPILEGSSDLGPRSLKPRQNALLDD
jgi:hypothetical protein